MTVRRIQYLLASVFFVLGGWCLLSPGSVIDLTVTEAHRAHTPLTHLMMGAFGAQALIAGLFAATAIFTRRTFLAYGIALLPFFVFDYWFYVVDPMLTTIGMLDAAGNMVMLVLCWLGWRSAGKTPTATGL